MLYLIKACFVLIFLTGLFLVCAALFLYEDEEGMVQNVLEDLWLKLEDKRNKFLSRHAAFMRVIAEATDSIFTRLFGKKLFSLRALVALAYFSHASLYLTFAFQSLFEPAPRNIIFFATTMFLLYVIAGAIPIITKHPASFTGCAGLAFVLLGVLAPFILVYKVGSMRVPGDLAFLFSCAVGLGIISDIVFIALTRQLLRWSAGLRSFYKIAAVVLLNCLLAFASVVVPFLLAVWLQRSSWRLNLAVIAVSFVSGLVARFNSLTALTALLFVVLALVMLIHRLFWPALERPIYTLQRVGIARRSKLLGTIGIILMGLALGVQPSWLKDIVGGLIP